MGNDYSNGTASDTLESLKAEREHLAKTVAGMRQMTRDFDTLAERRKSFDAKRVAFHLQLKNRHLRRCVWRGIITPEAFQWHKEAIARKKALGDQMVKDAAAYGQAVVRWAEDLEKREKQQQQAALSPGPSVPIVTGGNALNDTEFRWTFDDEYLKYSDVTLPGFGAEFNNQVFRGGEVNYIGVGIGFAMAGIPIWEADDIAAVRKNVAILARVSGYHQMTDAEYNWMKFGYSYADQTMQGDRWWK